MYMRVVFAMNALRYINFEYEIAQSKFILPSNSLKLGRIEKYQQYIIADFEIIKSERVVIVLQYFSKFPHTEGYIYMHILGLHVESSKISQIIFVLTSVISSVRMLLFTSVFLVIFLMK